MDEAVKLTGYQKWRNH